MLRIVTIITIKIHINTIPLLPAPNHIIIIGPSATLGSEFNIVKNGSITLDKNLLQYKIIPIINTLVKVPVSISNEESIINPETGECSVIIEETPKYHMTSYASIKAKDGEDYIGDSYSFSKNNEYIFICRCKITIFFV